MKNELWTFIKNSFGKRLALYYLVILSLSFFISAIPLVSLKLALLGVFFGASAVMLPLFASSFKSQLGLVFAKKHEASQNIKDQVNQIAEQMKTKKPKKILIARGIFNAYVRFGTLVLGELLLNSLSSDALEGVIAHELAHQKRRHTTIMVSCTMGLFILPTLSWQRIYSPIPIIFNDQFTLILLNIMIFIGSLAYVCSAPIPLNWFIELDADKIATRTIGKAKMIIALLDIVKKDDFKESSESHPAISERVKRILNMHDAPA